MRGTSFRYKYSTLCREVWYLLQKWRSQGVAMLVQSSHQPKLYQIVCAKCSWLMFHALLVLNLDLTKFTLSYTSSNQKLSTVMGQITISKVQSHWEICDTWEVFYKRKTYSISQGNSKQRMPCKRLGRELAFQTQTSSSQK